ncbi:hypothetical protein ELT72_20675 [Escherichia coli]|nr:hypothetical protein ELT72_20675 [Escherichia coli]
MLRHIDRITWRNGWHLNGRPAHVAEIRPIFDGRVAAARSVWEKYDDAPRDKCTLSCAINGIHAAFHYLKKNYISGCVMTVPTG